MWAGLDNRHILNDKPVNKIFYVYCPGYSGIQDNEMFENVPPECLIDIINVN